MHSYGDMRGGNIILKKSEKTRIFYIFALKSRIFYVLQLVCGQDLRSFVSKTYVRLWGTLDDGSEGLFKLTVDN